MTAQPIKDYHWNFNRGLSTQLFGVFLSAVFMFGCGSTSDNGSSGSCTVNNATATTSVTVGNNFFDPSCIKVAAGATVTWTNTGLPTHTVTSDAGAPESFDSGSLGANGTFSHTFTTAETVNYHCTIHVNMGMTGTVIVQ